jgi:hypothetical protein
MKKKIAIALACVLLVVGVASAQVPVQPQVQAQTTKVTGKLDLVQGTIAIKSGSKTYIVPALQRLAGFVKGVEEGSAVTVEGYESPLPYTSDVIFLHVTKLTVGGKDYDLSAAFGRGWGMQGKRGGMMRGPRW